MLLQLDKAKNPRWPPQRACARTHGIALLVVLIVFVVLYLVVYQLHFSTTMEERLAQVRYGEVESDLAQHSVALYVLTLLQEDLRSGGAAGAGGPASHGDDGTGMTLPGAEGAAGLPTEGMPGAPESETGGQFVPLNSDGTAVGAWYDYVHENMFNENRQQVGDTTVKVTIVDGERCFGLNQLFEYVRLPDEEIISGGVGISEDDVLSTVEGAASDEEAAEALKARFGSGRTRSQLGRGNEEDDEEGIDGLDEDPLAGDGLTDDYEPDPEFIRPAEERIQLTIDMVSRAVLMLLSINEDNGYHYSARYFADSVASAIVEYILMRREDTVQNRIYLTSELLNVEGITPELFYGPTPVLPAGEEVQVGEGFVLKRDEFGDIAPEYIYSDYDEAMHEEEHGDMEELMGEFGRFASFPPELGFSPLQSNPLTRGMQEPVIEIDEDETEYVVAPPVPLGLKDLFTTFTTGKININTASVPVLFALAMSLEEEEAAMVAHDIAHYRSKFQEEMSEEELDGDEALSDRDSPDLGQPRRQPPTEGAASGPLADILGADAMASLGQAGMPPGMLDQLSQLDAADLAALGSGYENLETNYFTNLQQLELIDGSEGGPDDLLSSDAGVARVDNEDDSLLRRLIHDYEKSAVFGSTYFNVELKAKAEKGRSVKTGYLTVRRDPQRSMIEILMWKELEK
jgi:hypothetical protein